MVHQALACFGRARERADDSVIRARVEKASICAYKAALLTVPVSWRFADNAVNRVRAGEADSLLATYTALCSTYNVTMHNEATPLDQFLKQFRQPATVPANQIENAVWQITVLPGYNGSMVGLFHKPSGRQMLRALQTSDPAKGRLETYVVAGTYPREDHLNCRVSSTPEAITLTKELDDGTAEERVICLSPAEPGKVHVSFRLLQGRPGPQVWQFYSQAGWDPGTSSAESEALTVYARTKEWQVVNRSWHVDDGPDAQTLLHARGGGFAFYNHQAKFGALITYSPKWVRSTCSGILRGRN